MDEAIARLERDGKRSRIPNHRLLSSTRESGGGYRDARRVSRNPQHLEIDDHRVVGFDGEGQPIEIARDEIAYVDSLPSGDRTVSKRLGQHALLTAFDYLDWSHCLFVRLHDGRTIVIAQGLEGPTARAACALLEDHLGLLAPEPRRPRARIETEPAVDDDEAEPARGARAATSASVAPEADTD